MLIHPTAEVSSLAHVGDGTYIWNHVQVRERASIGSRCVLGKGVYVDVEVKIGDDVKVENGAQLFRGVVVENGVFIGPLVCFTNDRYPRSISPNGEIKTQNDWDIGSTLVRYGASIGAGAIVIPNLTIGRYAMVAAGAVVTRAIPDHALVSGNPARVQGWVCRCGHRLNDALHALCSHCGTKLNLTEENQ